MKFRHTAICVMDHLQRTSDWEYIEGRRTPCHTMMPVRKGAVCYFPSAEVRDRVLVESPALWAAGPTLAPRRRDGATPSAIR
jgi:hypothetical protein